MKEGEQQLLLNPFVVGGEFKVKCVPLRKSGFMVDRTDIDSDGIVSSPVSVVERVSYFDGGRATKLFHGQHEDTLIGLKPNAKNLFLWIAMNLGDGTDYISLNPEKICNELSAMAGKYGRSSYFTAISELKGAGIISHRKKGTYWVNPKVIFNGSRIKLYTNYYDGKNYTTIPTIGQQINK